MEADLFFYHNCFRLKMKLLLLSVVGALPLSCFKPSDNLYGNSVGDSISDIDILFDYYSTDLKLSYVTCCTNPSSGVLEGL